MPETWTWAGAPVFDFCQSPVSHLPSPLSFTLSPHLLLNVQSIFHIGVLPAMGVGLREAYIWLSQMSQGHDTLSLGVSQVCIWQELDWRAPPAGTECEQMAWTDTTKKTDGCPQTHCSPSSVVRKMCTNSSLTPHYTPTSSVKTKAIDSAKNRQTHGAPWMLTLGEHVRQ